MRKVYVRNDQLEFSLFIIHSFTLRAVVNFGRFFFEHSELQMSHLCDICE